MPAASRSSVKEIVRVSPSAKVRIFRPVWSRSSLRGFVPLAPRCT